MGFGDSDVLIQLIQLIQLINVFINYNQCTTLVGVIDCRGVDDGEWVIWELYTSIFL